MVKISKTMVVVIAGNQNKEISRKVWLIDPQQNFEIEEWPKLNNKRRHHTCESITINHKLTIVCAGGQGENGKMVTSIEYLTIDQLANGWYISKSVVF